MKKRILALCLLISLCLPLLASCSQEKKQTAETFEYFNTYSTLTVYCGKEEFSLYREEFLSTLKQYHQLFDIYNSYDGATNLKDVNERAPLSAVKISSELFDALTLGKDIHSLTSGKCNIALGTVTSIWHDIREAAQNAPENIIFPTQEVIDDALLHTDINALELDRENLTVRFSDERLSLDFGAIAKGYVTSLLCDKLIALGCKSFLINLGGNVASYGKKPKNATWSALVKNPFEDNSLGYNEIIYLNSETLVTSGSYQRFFIYDNKRYSHIIDSDSGYPAERFESVSVQAHYSSSALADALSTALFCMSYEEGCSLVSSLDGVSALWIFNDGSYKTSEGFGGTK